MHGIQEFRSNSMDRAVLKVPINVTDGVNPYPRNNHDLYNFNQSDPSPLPASITQYLKESILLEAFYIVRM